MNLTYSRGNQSHHISPMWAIVIIALSGVLLYSAYVTISYITVMKAKPARNAVISLADHLGFLFGYGEAGLNGFPDPFNRHDPKKENHLKTNGDHIRRSLKGIEKNLGRNQNLRDFLRKALKDETRYKELTKALDDLAYDLQNKEYFYEQFGSEIGDDILDILIRTGYIVP